MLKEDDVRLQEFFQIAINDDKYNSFVDAFSEFIHELSNVDLSEKTIQHLYDLFIKDMNMYFKNKEM